jgi:hypothetical protein
MSDDEKTQEQIRKETVEWMEKNSPQPIRFQVNREQKEQIMKIIGNKTPSIDEKQDEFEEHMRSFVRQLRQAKEEDEEFIRRDAELKNGGKGSVSMTPEMLKMERRSGISEGYSTHEEMIDDLRKRGDRETLNKIWEKSLNGLKNDPQKCMNFSYSDPWIDGKSAIRHKLDADNKKARGET